MNIIKYSKYCTTEGNVRCLCAVTLHCPLAVSYHCYTTESTSETPVAVLVSLRSLSLLAPFTHAVSELPGGCCCLIPTTTAKRLKRERERLENKHSITKYSTTKGPVQPEQKAGGFIWGISSWLVSTINAWSRRTTNLIWIVGLFPVLFASQSSQ